jgi:class 3 adenylate cyclase
MITKNNEELVKRIARLVRQNKELEEQLKVLLKKIENLSGENEKLKAEHEKLIPGKTSGEKISARAGRSLKFDMVTVLFSDIHTESILSEEGDSASVMDELDEILYEFDQIALKYKIEKIKTIGDTFMCAGGIPEKNITNPVDVVMAALEMRTFLSDYESRHSPDGRKGWKFKVGIHTGPVTAGVTGKKKINYDIKGDTVNSASRLEKISEKGLILISVMTYELVKEFFDCEYFGKLPVKYKGDLQVYRVKGLKNKFSADSRGTVPNDAFRIKFGLIRFTDIQEIVLDRLERELPAHLYYHNVKHTVDVVTEVELIGLAEGCSDEEILILKTAALFHDTGHTVAYDEHEFQGTLIAREMLPEYDYTPGQIELVCSLIMSTRLPPEPSSLLEKIICDSDLDYLGRSDFIPVSNSLFEELKAQNKMGSLNEWNKLQVKFISGHQYFTRTARKLREVNKQQQIKRIQSLIS